MRLPLTFDPVSNGEFVPLRKTARDAAMQDLARTLVTNAVRRTGMDRRAFLKSSCAMAACLAAIDTVAAAGGGSYALPPDATLDPAAADTVLAGEEFIFDIQTHHVMPGKDWEKHNPAMRTLLRLFPGKTDFGRRAFLKEIFLDSDTTCAVLSAVPASAEGQPLPQEEAENTRKILETLGGAPRLWVHALVTPNVGDLDEQLDAMAKVKERYPIAAWKVYTLFGPGGKGWWLDDEQVGIPFLEKARALGIKTVCTHKGFPLSMSQKYAVARDVGAVAKRFPDVKFVVYHSGYDPRVPEGAYDEEKADKGVDCLIRSMHDHGIEPGGNVYAELGSTWFSVMREPRKAAHVLGKLLQHCGEDNVLWGTDSIWYGSPQPQIAAFRAFEIDQELCAQHGYPELTKERKAKVFGLNAAKVYGVEPKRDLPAIKRDAVEKLKQAYLPVREPSFRVYGPRTRRELFALLARRGGMPA